MSALRADPLTLAEAARIMREATKDKSYQASVLVWRRRELNPRAIPAV